MNAYFQRVSLKNRVQGTKRRLDPVYRTGRGDPSDFGGPTIRRGSSRFTTIGALENCVSLLQIDYVHKEQIRGWLQEMKDFLTTEVSYTARSTIPSSVVNAFLEDRLIKIRMISEAACYRGKTILDGTSGVRGETHGSGLHFVRGSGRVVSSKNRIGYPVAILREARPAVLKGAEPITPEMLKAENMIVIVNDTGEACYKVENDENPDTLVSNLQQCLLKDGLDISVFRTKDDRLLFSSNQPGSGDMFKGASEKTCLVSSIPGYYMQSAPGVDVAGMVGTEPAEGSGGFLIGRKGNRRTDGLIVYFDGKIDYPGQIKGYVKVEQNGIGVPLDATGKETEILCLPCVYPELLGIGVSNHSGFVNLKSIRVNTEKERMDALRLILWSLTDLEYMQDELQKKEDDYVELAVELLRNGLKPKTAGEEIFSLSKNKAGKMAKQLKKMVLPPVAS